MSPLFVGGRKIYDSSSAPSSGVTEGDEYYNSAENQKYITAVQLIVGERASGGISTTDADPFGDGSVIATFL